MKIRFSIVAAVVLAVTVMNPGSRAASLQTGPEQAKPHSQSGARQGGPPRESGGQRSRLPFWKDPAIVKEVGITAEQAKQIDRLWHERSKEMAGRADELQKQEVELKRMIAARTVSADVVALQIDRVEAQRTMLYKSRTLMLYRMALVLTPEQNKSMEAIWVRLFGLTSTSGRGDGRGSR